MIYLGYKGKKNLTDQEAQNFKRFSVYNIIQIFFLFCNDKKSGSKQKSTGKGRGQRINIP